MIAAGGLSGGISSVITGGKFWTGFRQGAITSGLNHLAHGLARGIELNKEMNTTLKEMGYELDGDPPYEYNGKTYESKGSLYGAILVDQFAEQFGIKDVVALATALDDAFPTAPKRFQMPGASKNSSWTSKVSSKLLPQEMPKRLPTPNIYKLKMGYTSVLGRFLGRMAGPIGWGILAYDVGTTLYNTQVIYNRIINQ
jgi:hypothetical protein